MTKINSTGDRTDNFQKACDAWFTAQTAAIGSEMRYEEAYANAYMTAKGTIQENGKPYTEKQAESDATLQTIGVRESMLYAQAKAQAAYHLMRHLRDLPVRDDA